MLPSAPTTTGSTSVFNFHSFPNSICKSWYLSIFSCSFTMIFWSSGIAMSMIKQLFAILLIDTISGCLCSITLSVWMGKSHKTLHPSFSSTESGTYSHDLSLHSRWNFLHSSQWIFIATLSCLFRYWFFARLGQALMMCVILSAFSLQSLQHGISLVFSMLYFTELVLIACSYTVQRRLLALLSSTTPTFYFHCGNLFPSQIVNAVPFAFSLSIGFLFFLAHNGNVFLQVEVNCCSLNQGLLILCYLLC